VPGLVDREHRAVTLVALAGIGERSKLKKPRRLLLPEVSPMLMVAAVAETTPEALTEPSELANPSVSVHARRVRPR